MLKITIPGQNELSVKNAVFDFNGTLATDGKLKSSVREMLVEIEKFLDIYILSSDTYGSVQNEFVRLLGADDTICIGNGKNDIGMFEICALSILVVGEEGCSVKTLLKSDIVVKNSEDALMLLMNPKRITATLRE